jgi:hypothetical protein
MIHPFARDRRPGSGANRTRPSGKNRQNGNGRSCGTPSSGTSTRDPAASALWSQMVARPRENDQEIASELGPESRHRAVLPHPAKVEVHIGAWLPPPSRSLSSLIRFRLLECQPLGIVSNQNKGQRVCRRPICLLGRGWERSAKRRRPEAISFRSTVLKRLLKSREVRWVKDRPRESSRALWAARITGSTPPLVPTPNW